MTRVAIFHAWKPACWRFDSSPGHHPQRVHSGHTGFPPGEGSNTQGPRELRLGGSQFFNLTQCL